MKKGKDLGHKSVSVSSLKSGLVKGPIMQMAVYIDVTSDMLTEPSFGRNLLIHTLHLVCCIVGAIMK